MKKNMKKFKKILAVVMAVTITLLTMDVTQVFAKPGNKKHKTQQNEILIETTENQIEIDNILDEFSKDFKKNDSARNISDDLDAKEKEFMSRYGNKIVSLGYEPHIVHADNYEDCVNALNTDLASIGLDANGTYLILIEGDSNGQNNARASTSYSYGYDYNGTRYKMRKFTVRAADNPSFYKASTCDLLNTTSKTLIKNCLDTVISAYISSVSSVLGTVASISGLNSSMFNGSGRCTLVMHAATTWTRVYTQVYLTDREEWVNGSCVEYATAESYMSGLYYNSATNSSCSVQENWTSRKLYSPRYYDDGWRNEMAVIYATNREGIRYDLTGTVKYKHGGKVKVTHYENF